MKHGGNWERLLLDYEAKKELGCEDEDEAFAYSDNDKEYI